ncbi:magnesium transporter [Phormidium yuhuli AB48]|uniref:Magnesium transporter MgtE n=1 Tax=Phormidium yuhuli AB48 TaxID=2940671 RepID=A0ABY5ALV7_9CYAN|nr:magnesium transporter [Phormidium yuhuli]USR90194.1 magnesium transporter [Phormidium yuhuli AB48]
MVQSQDIEQPISSRRELRELVRSQLQTFLEQGQLQEAKLLLVPVQAVDVADVIGELPEKLHAIAFRLLPKDEATEVYEYLDRSVQQSLLQDFKNQEIRDLVEQMSPDDRARLFDELPAKVVRQLLPNLSPTEREATSLLLGYQPDTAGRIMTPEYISLKEHLTVSAALERIRHLAEVTETVYALYVTDAARHLTGILSLRDLVVAQPEQTIGEILTRDAVFVHTDTDQEDVARVIQRYDFLAVPVVDSEQRLVGIVTVDDVIDVFERETTEDIYALGGVQSDGENYFQMSLFRVSRQRVSWLLILLVTNVLTSAVIRANEGVLSQLVSLAMFIPLLIGTGGNVGTQSSTVIIRGLNIDKIQTGGAWRLIRREAIAGLMLGTMLGLLVAVGAYLLQGNLIVALSAGSSLIVIAMLASTSGAALPILFKSLGFDPALMSAPFITTCVDVLGVLTYFTIARILLGVLPLEMSLG